MLRTALVIATVLERSVTDKVISLSVPTSLQPFTKLSQMAFPSLAPSMEGSLARGPSQPL